jgi:hypothetical protein
MLMIEVADRHRQDKDLNNNSDSEKEPSLVIVAASVASVVEQGEGAVGLSTGVD